MQTQDTQVTSSSTEIKTFIDENGQSWVDIPDELWQSATMMDYVGGFPIYTRRP